MRALDESPKQAGATGKVPPGQRNRVGRLSFLYSFETVAGPGLHQAQGLELKTKPTGVRP